MEEDIEELKRLLYRDELSQYGKRKLLNYCEQQEKDYKRALEINEVLLKENEELKNDYENLSNSVVVKNHYIKNSIPVQKVKDKIEEIQEEGYWLFTTDRDSDKCVEVLQELIEKREDK